MRLDKLITEAEIPKVAIIFGRFNPPHFGHKGAWQKAAQYDNWYVGTNPNTQGAKGKSGKAAENKDPLPYEVKVAAMEAIMPEIKGHIIPETNWWSLATAIYNKHGKVHLVIISDAEDGAGFVKGLARSNGVEGRHGYYHFADITHDAAPRASSATDLRAAIKAGDREAFAKAAGVDADMKIQGKPYFDLVSHYLMGTEMKESSLGKIVRESLQLNEDLSTFTSLGIPAAIAKRAIKEYNFPHDVKLEEVPKPTAKQFTDGDAYFIAGRTPEKSGFVIRQSYRSVSGGFYSFFKFNEEGKVISGQPESLAKAIKGMSGKVYKIKQGWMEPRNTTGGKSADSTKGDVLGPNAALHQIFAYIKQAFGDKVDAKLAKIERNIKEAMLNLMDYPDYDKYGRGPGQSMRGTQSAIDYANDMLKQIKAFREDGKLTGRPTYEQFLRSIKKYSNGWGSHYTNQDNILEFLKTPNGRAKYVRSFLKDAEYTYAEVAKLQGKMMQNAMAGESVEEGYFQQSVDKVAKDWNERIRTGKWPDEKDEADRSLITYLNDKGKKVTGRVAKRSTNSPKGYFLDTGEFVSQQRVIAKESLGEAEGSSYRFYVPQEQWNEAAKQMRLMKYADYTATNTDEGYVELVFANKDEAYDAVVGLETGDIEVLDADERIFQESKKKKMPRQYKELVGEDSDPMNPTVGNYDLNTLQKKVARDFADAAKAMSTANSKREWINAIYQIENNTMHQVEDIIDAYEALNGQRKRGGIKSRGIDANRVESRSMLGQVVAEQDLEEGVNDPHIFKAVFLAGGPGSGKSFVSDKLMRHNGLRVVNSDDIYEYLMKKQDLDLDPETIFSPQGQEIRGKAKNLTNVKKKGFLDGRIGLIIDGTGKDVEKVKREMEKLKNLGYDCMMLFVNTSLEVAQERNQQRERSLDPRAVEKMWSEVQNNIMKFQQVFGSANFVVLDNSGGLEDPTRAKEFRKVWKHIEKFVNEPPQSYIAKKWIKQQRGQRQ